MLKKIIGQGMFFYFWRFEFLNNMTEIIPKNISIADRKQLDFWCRYFNCTSKDLLEALDKIGSCTEEVKLYLDKKPGKKGLSFWWEYMQ